MEWYLESQEGKVEANIRFKDGLWSQEGLNQWAWEDMLAGVGLEDGTRLSAGDGLAFLAGIKRVLEASGSKLVEGAKPLSATEDLPPYSLEEGDAAY